MKAIGYHAPGPIDRDDIIKGYEIAKNDYVLLDDDEIEAVKIESKKMEQPERTIKRRNA